MADDFQSLDVNGLLDQLRTTPTNFDVTKDPTPPLPPISSVPPSEDDLGEFIIRKTTELVDQTMQAYTKIRDMAMQSNDAEVVEALASLVKSTSGALDGLNKIHIQNKKTKAAKDIANIQADSRKKAAETLVGGNNIMVGSREEVLKMIAEAVHKQKIASGPVVEGELVSDQEDQKTLEIATSSESDNEPEASV